VLSVYVLLSETGDSLVGLWARSLQHAKIRHQRMNLRIKKITVYNENTSSRIISQQPQLKRPETRADRITERYDKPLTVQMDMSKPTQRILTLKYPI